MGCESKNKPAGAKCLAYCLALRPPPPDDVRLMLVCWLPRVVRVGICQDLVASVERVSLLV